MSNVVTNINMMYQTNWVTNTFTNMIYQTNTITNVQVTQSGWDWGLFVQVIVAVTTVATVIIMWKTQREVQQARKEEKEENQKIRELNMLMRFIEKYDSILLTNRDLRNEGIREKLIFLIKEYNFMVELSEMMISMKYYNRYWILKDINDLLKKTEDYRNSFSFTLIKDLETIVSAFIGTIKIFLWQDEKTAKKGLEKLKGFYFNEELYTKIDKEIDNIEKGIQN